MVCWHCSFSNTLYVFSGNETIAGKVYVTPSGGKKLEHTGIKIELIGQVGTLCDEVIVVCDAFGLGCRVQTSQDS